MCHHLITLNLSERVWVSFFCWTQKKIFWRMLVIKQLLVPIELNSIFSPYYGSQWLPAIVWLPTFFKISSFVFNKRKKVIHVWNNLSLNVCQNNSLIFCILVAIFLIFVFCNLKKKKLSSLSIWCVYVWCSVFVFRVTF